MPYAIAMFIISMMTIMFAIEDGDIRIFLAAIYVILAAIFIAIVEEKLK